MKWISMESLADIEDAITRSSSQPVIIFKHSRLCSLSSMVLNALEGDWNEMEVGEVATYFLDLIAFRQVSNAVASKLEVTHQSPQLLVLQDGKCIHHSSHLSITYSSILQVVRS
jgi:bacillithiol system protein YtxJ